MTGLQPFDPGTLVLIALLNPAVALTGILMGRSADQPQKLPIAGFVAAVAGAALVWLGAWLGLMPTRGSGAEAGLFLLQMVVGMGWATVGYYMLRRPRS